MKPYLKSNETGQGELFLYGDIVDDAWTEGDVSSCAIAKQLQEIDAGEIRVYINSYGGSVAAGLAIYNSLKNHKAKIKTYCDGFACSIASVIFMAGDERIMSDASLLMVHNPWMHTIGNADELRKTAEDLEKIGQASIAAYMGGVTITGEELQKLLDDETWLGPSEALDYGFATSIKGAGKQEKYSQSIRKGIMQRLLKREMPNQAGEGPGPLPQEPEPAPPPEEMESGEQEKTINGNEKALTMMGAFLNAFNKKER